MKNTYKIGTVLTDDAVINYARCIHYSKMDFDEGNIVERIEKFSTYELREINVEELEDPCHNIDEDLIQEYIQKRINEMPPLILGYYHDNSFMTIDGGHRTAILKELNRQKALAFVGIK